MASIVGLAKVSPNKAFKLDEARGGTRTAS
jgi:hypothetical protein